MGEWFRVHAETPRCSGRKISLHHTWEGLGDDLVLHYDVWDLGLDLDSLSGQLGKDLLTQQNILGRLQLHMPRLGTWDDMDTSTLDATQAPPLPRHADTNIYPPNDKRCMNFNTLFKGTFCQKIVFCSGEGSG